MATINRKTGLTLLCAAAILLPAAMASAQSAEGRIRYYASPGYAGEGMPYRDCSLGADPAANDGAGGDEGMGMSTAPASRDMVTLPTGLSREEAAALRDAQRVELGRQITQFNDLLATMPATYPNRPVILFRKAEALRELADSDYLVSRADFNECVNNWYQCASDADCYEPMPDYTEAISEYGAIARNHPSYDRLDEVIFRLGETLMENDAAAEGTQYLTRLVNTYPQSQYIPDARLMMGEHFFENGLLLAARQNYDEVLNYPESSLYNYAIYKLGWVDINDYQHEDALTRFQTVVSNLSANPSDSLDFRNQSLNDMLLAYAELDQGWARARDYYLQVEDEQFMRRKLSQLSGLFDEQGKDESRLEILSYFLDRYPNDRQIPQWMQDSIDSLGKIGDWNRTESTARAFIGELDPNATWALSNSDNAAVLRGARVSSEAWLLMIINRNDTEARRINNDLALKGDLFREVATDYEEFFRRFADSGEAYGQRFYFAELLYYQLANGGECGTNSHYIPTEECDRYLRDAGGQYRAVVEMQPDPTAEHAHDAAVGALQVYDEFMARTNASVDRDLPAPSEYETFFGARQELNEDAQNYVDIVEWFANLYPDDELIPAASWRAASLYLYAAQIEEAAERFETIIEHHPNHRFAQQAALAAFVCYNQVENWPRIESVARRLLTSCDGDDSICQTASLQQAIAYAMNNQAEDLIEAGDSLRINGEERAAMESYLAAADKRVALYREFPTSEWSPVALMNAAATYEQARQIRTSIELYNEFLTAYPEHGMVPEAIYTLGLIHDSQAEFAAAADWFERLDAYPTFEERNQAVISVARLREALSDFDNAIRRYEQYMTLDPSSDTTKAIYFQIAGIELDRNNPDAAFSRLQAFLDRFTDDSARRITAVHMQAEIRREQGQTAAALALYDQVYTMYGRGTASWDEAGQWAGWSVAPGANFAEGDRNAAIPLVAEAVFRRSDLLYEAARASDLTYRAGRVQELTTKLIARGEALQAAERAMFETYNVGDAEWGVAATVRIGQLYMDFYRDLYNVPAPDYDECLDATGADYDLCDAAAEEFDAVLFQYGAALEAKAMAAWVSARVTAVDNRIYTEWVTTLIDEMNDADRSWRVGGAQGVSARHTKDPYIATLYILDLTEKLAAFEDFVVPVPGLGGTVVDPLAVPVEGAPVEAPAVEAAPSL